MNDFTITAALVIFYRSLTVIAGTTIVFLGYRLFRVGVFEKAGELRAAWGESALALKQAAPGTFFALFGATIIIFGLWRGITFDRTAGLPVPTKTEQASIPARNSDSLAIAMFGQSIPKEVRAVLDKVAEGQSLTTEEQAAVKTWIEHIESIRIHASLNGDSGPMVWEGLRDNLQLQ